ncbi:AMP-binding protein [Nocardia sp. NPDC004068]|uniref:AMP-binding protein n=1 Tax=Nocardia sp. NPDC004068 TaxID=3364303 RepID=UPI0036A2FDEE
MPSAVNERVVTSDEARSSFSIDQRRTSPAALLSGQFTRDRVPLRKPVNAGLIAELAAERFGRTPVYLDSPFLWDPQQRLELDYVEFAELVRNFSAVLYEAGVRRWDRVAIVKTPNYDIQALAAAAARIGAIPALISAKLDSDIINILLERVRPKVVITDTEVARYVGLTEARLRELSAIAIAPIDGGVPLEKLWGATVPDPSPLREEDPMVITHTSSTTGVSKLAEASAKGVSWIGLMESIFPFAHGPNELFGSVISHVHIRAVINFLATFSRGTPLLGVADPSNENIADIFGRYRPTIVEAHPNKFMDWEEIADHPNDPFASVRVYFNTFDAIHPRTIQRLLEASKRRFPVWLQCYGMTEVQAVTVRPYTRASAARSARDNSRSVGWELPGVRARIADPETGKRRRDQSEPGMIQVKTPSRALSFVGTPEKFSERRHGKWFDTGDWGRRGKWGQLEVLDRVADRIEGVQSCLWIEDQLLDGIPDAEEIVVVPDGDGKPVPVICMRPGRSLDPDVWQKASRGITGLGEPFEVTPEALHRTATAKARRYLLTELVKREDHRRAQELQREIVLRDGA